jgi:hypothetical protein
MKDIILAQNIRIAKEGLEDIIRNITMLENLSGQYTKDLDDIRNNSNKYLDDLKQDISINQVDKILDFVSKKHKELFDKFS